MLLCFELPLQLLDEYSLLLYDSISVVGLGLRFPSLFFEEFDFASA